GNVLSFLVDQGRRPLQHEATLSTPWVWMSVLHVPGALNYQDYALETREVTGPGDAWIVDNGSVVMAVALAVIAVVISWAHLRGADSGRLLLSGSLALSTAFIVFNKVGSPQYVLWLVPIVVAALANGWRSWRVPAVMLGG
ncbi:hypothetical protein ACC691_36470, partial [Rhizobium johnstonii]|uniref:hypothetical protein n=1 Tax=Rhizobium johnstonii TaxID=3019933 RepID=UPI003F989B93